MLRAASGLSAADLQQLALSTNANQGLTATQRANAQANLILPTTWALKPAANSVPVNYEITVTDVGVANVTFYSNGTRWLAKGGMFTAKVDNVDVNTTGTTEIAASTYTCPADLLGPNGGIDVEVICAVNGSVNAKNSKVYIGGLAGTLMASLTSGTSASTLALSYGRAIFNRNSVSSQVSEASSSTAYGTSTTAVSTSSVNTANATDFVVSIQATNAADTMTSKCIRWVVTTAP